MTGAETVRDAAAAAAAITDRIAAQRSDRLVDALQREFMVDPALVTVVDLDRRHVVIGGRRFQVERRRRSGEVVYSLRELDAGGVASWRLGRADSPTKLAALLRDCEPAPVSRPREVAAGVRVIVWFAVTVGLLWAALGHAGPLRTPLLVAAAVVAVGGSMLARRRGWLRPWRLAGGDSTTLQPSALDDGTRSCVVGRRVAEPGIAEGGE